MKNFTIFDDNLVGVHISKKKIMLNKPIYLGSVILDESKVVMYNFHYNFMLKNIPRSDIDLLFTDTDSLCYHIKKIDCDEFIMKHKDKFDLSNYDKNHVLYDDTNKKVIGKVKNESPNNQITEFVGLRAKLYCYTKDGYKGEEKRCKGVKRNVVKNKLNMEMYKNCLFNRENQSVSQNGIRSYGHKLYSETVNKVGLSYCDDKVYISNDNVNTYNFGHKMLRHSHHIIDMNEKFETLYSEVKNLM